MLKITKSNSFQHHFFIAALFLLSCLFFSTTSFAADSQEMGFTVEPKFPTNQIDQSVAYYHLKVQPKDQQDLIVLVKSTRKEPVTVEVSVNDAVTNLNGMVEYGQEKPKLDPSLKIPLSKILTVPKESKKIKVANFEEKQVLIHLAVPTQPFDGIKLGGIRFLEAADQKKEGIQNRYGYTVGVMLTEDESDYNLGGDLKLKKVHVDVTNGMKGINIDLQNPEPKILSNLEVQTQVFKKGEKNVFLNRSQKGMAMAPNSNFSFIIPWGIEKIIPGKYVAEIAATDGNKKWKWSKEFEITGNVAKNLNKKAINKLQIVKPVLFFLITLLVVFLGITIYRFYIENHWNEEEKKNDQKKRNKKKKHNG